MKSIRKFFKKISKRPMIVIVSPLWKMSGYELCLTRQIHCIVTHTQDPAESLIFRMIFMETSDSQPIGMISRKPEGEWEISGGKSSPRNSQNSYNYKRYISYAIQKPEGYFDMRTTDEEEVDESTTSSTDVIIYDGMIEASWGLVQEMFERASARAGSSVLSRENVIKVFSDSIMKDVAEGFDLDINLDE